MERFENSNYPYQKETYKIIGIAMEIHKVLGKGLSEIVYKDAFEYELKSNNISFEREKEYIINYKEIVLPHKFYADFVVFDKIILEIKSKKSVIEDHYNQVLNYLAISKLEVGLLINFHENSLEYKRIVLTK
ncbi:MAG: GxxExxY protein [Sphingobacteriales bacterium]|jgi:GxxExxY protein|nr:GxxExxY protein [Sphingobacteriales bacterium]